MIHSQDLQITRFRKPTESNSVGFCWIFQPLFVWIRGFQSKVLLESQWFQRYFWVESSIPIKKWVGNPIESNWVGFSWIPEFGIAKYDKIQKWTYMYTLYSLLVQNYAKNNKTIHFNDSLIQNIRNPTESNSVGFFADSNPLLIGFFNPLRTVPYRTQYRTYWPGPLPQ